MVQGPVLLLILATAIAVIIILNSVLKIHPFITMMLTAFGVGFTVGMPPVEIVKTINAGFGAMMGNIGLMIVTGTLMGVILEKSGAAIQIANAVIRVFGSGRPAASVAVIGGLMGIPVYCDSGFVVLTNLGKRLALRAGKNPAGVGITLGGSLYATHTLVPPTPGPIAAAGSFGASLGTVIMIGLAVAVPTIVVAYVFIRYAARKVQVKSEVNVATPVSEIRNLPSTLRSFVPLVVPLLCIAGAAFGRMSQLPGWAGLTLEFLGQPLMALLIGVLLGMALLMPAWDEEHLTRWISAGVAQAGPILLITGSSGAFGALLKATPLTQYVEGLITGSQATGNAFVVIAFLLAALFKTAQGSTTAAMVISSALLAPLAPQLGFDTSLELTILTMAVGSGAMTVSHANDSYFWVISQFTGLTLRDAYRNITIMSLLMGLTGLLITLLIFNVIG